jgi:7-cyano-7-deazaguanine synthase
LPAHQAKCCGRLALGVAHGLGAQFRQSCLETFRIGNWESHLVDYYTPYMETNKFGILQDGEKCCEQLGLDFDEVYKRTNTSYKPIFILGKGAITRLPNGLRGGWFSDFKSASSVERIEAFIKLGRPDSVEYADETGPVSWETVVEHVKQVLKNDNSIDITIERMSI